MPTSMSVIKPSMNKVAPAHEGAHLKRGKIALEAGPSKLEQEDQIAFKFPKEKAKQRRQRLVAAFHR